MRTKSKEFEALIGKKFGEWLILSVFMKDKRRYANCICSCGRTGNVRIDRLKFGKSNSCGFLPHKKNVPMRLDIPPKTRFGRLSVIEYSHHIENRAYFKVICDCGTIKTVRYDGLKAGVVLSCGCFNAERRLETITKHGGAYTSEYKIWAGMKMRCINSNNTEYSNYGGRGIAVCDRWLNSFENFIADVGLRPSSEYSIDRIDNNGNYEPGNVRWATTKEQARNTRRNKFLTIDSQTKCVAEWCELYQISQSAVHYRLQNNWDAESAVKVPSQHKGLDD